MATGLERWKDAAQQLEAADDRKFAQGLAGTAAGRAMLASVFGASPFLAECIVRDPAWVRSLWERGPDACARGALDELRSLGPDSDQAAAARTVRVVRRRVALTTGLADIARVWELEDVTRAMTTLAEEACSLACRILLRKLDRRGALSLPRPGEPEHGSGLIVLGLGKLGGHELNFSSDIDLILLFDPEVVPAKFKYEVAWHLEKLSRWLVAFLSEPSAEGQAFRVDLRLRPDPVSTPLVLSTKAALAYYEKRGLTWERAAMIKARPIAGDIEAGRAYLKSLESFVWRSHLDFATVQDLHGIKKRIDEQHRGGDIGARGQNIKLGRGGIREIEFFAQSHQLVWGGGNPALRVIPTCDALKALAYAGQIPSEAAFSLVNSYRYLRKVEHRIQMVADKQTHSLPSDPKDFSTLARFLGYAGGVDFSEQLVWHLQQVERQYESFFELPREMADASASSVLASRDRRETVQRLHTMGYRDPEAAFNIIERWRTGRCRAARDTQALDLLNALTPALIIAMCGTESPDLALRRFDAMIDQLADGYRAFTLFQANLHVMETVADIMVATPAMGTVLEARPELLEVLLDPETDKPAPSGAAVRAELEAHLQDGPESDDAFDRLRQWVVAARFKAGVQLLFHGMDPLDAPPLLTAIAESAVASTLSRAGSRMAAGHGRVPGGGAAIVARGKLARCELAFDSPLELALCYDAPAGARSDGRASLDAREYYVELWRRILGGIRGRSSARRTYALEVTSAPIALDGAAGGSGISGASLRGARLIAHDGGSAADFERALRTATGGSGRAGEDGGSDAGHAGWWSLETRPGGLAEITRAAAILRGRDGGPAENQVDSPSTGDLLADLERRGALSHADATDLAEAWSLWMRLSALGSLIGRSADEVVPQRLHQLFATAAGTESFEEVRERVDQVADAAQRVCARIEGASGR